MADLNVLCAICNEFYSADDVIYCTPLCGHLFHHSCLMRWLNQNRAPTCPQCRARCHRQAIHRIYLNFSERSADDDLPPLENPIQWIPLDVDFQWNLEGNVPSGAIQVGTDHEGNDTYVARVYYEDDLLPANYVPQKKAAYAPFGCHAQLLRNNVEILVDLEHKWVAAEGGQVPGGAIITGYTDQGENLYTGRGKYEGFTLLGKIHPSHGVLYMPFRGDEVNVREYEVLVLAPKEHAER